MIGQAKPWPVRMSEMRQDLAAKFAVPEERVRTLQPDRGPWFGPR